MKIYWFEIKLLDKSTNHATQTEMIKHFLSFNTDVKYFCGYKRKKKDFGLQKGIINYISMPRIPKIRGVFLRVGIILHLIKSLLITRPDIIIFDYIINLMIFPLLLIKKLYNKKTKIIMDIRTIPVKRMGFFWRHKTFLSSLYIAKCSCDGITFITPFMRDYYSQKINFKDIKTAVWTSGFAEGLFDTKKYQRNRGKKTFELFYHGGISLSRGIGSLIQAVKILKENNLPVSLKLIGNIMDRHAIENIIQKSHLWDVCKILQPVSYEKIPQMIIDCDLPVIPFPDFLGWRVSSPIKLMEYMALGKSIVLTDIEAHRNVVGNNDFAFYANSSKPEELAEAIERAYRSRDKLEIFGNKAREIALEKYTWRYQATKFYNFFLMF